MLNTFALPTLLALVSASPSAVQDAGEILATSAEMQAARRLGVDDYTVDQTAFAGTRNLVYYERIPGTELFRMVPLDEIAREGSDVSPEETAQMASGMATGLRMLGPALTSEMPAGSAALGLDNMMGDMVTFLDFTAEASRNVDDGTDDATDNALAMASFAGVAQVLGRETVAGRDAFHLRAEGLDMTQEGGEFTLESVSLWMDAEEYVPLRLLMEGSLSADGQTRPVTIEKLDQDYQAFGDMGPKVYESTRQIMRLSGMTGQMTPKQQEEIAEAREKMAELQQQLESLSPAQRRMIEGRLGPQMAQMEQLASGGTIEVVNVVNDIKVNAGPPTARDYGKAVAEQ